MRSKLNAKRSRKCAILQRFQLDFDVMSVAAILDRLYLTILSIFNALDNFFCTGISNKLWEPHRTFYWALKTTFQGQSRSFAAS